jgi:hypothetical protein
MHIDTVESIVNIGTEPWTGKPWYIGKVGSDAKLYEWQVPASEPLTYRWKSREFSYPRPTNFTVYQAYYDDTTGDPLVVKIWVTLRGNNGVVNKSLVYSQAVPASGREVRLPSGFRSDTWQLEFSGSAELQSFVMATNVAELRST